MSNLTPDDPVNHPAHYTSHPSGVECVTIAEHMNFCAGNAMKYIWRADLKSGTDAGAIEDYKKARFYIDREIERREKMMQAKPQQSRRRRCASGYFVDEVSDDGVWWRPVNQ